MLAILTRISLVPAMAVYQAPVAAKSSQIFL
jgi:hypothetical protein